MNEWMSVCVCVYVCICMYIYIYICTDFLDDIWGIRASRVNYTIKLYIKCNQTGTIHPFPELISYTNSNFCLTSSTRSSCENRDAVKWTISISYIPEDEALQLAQRNTFSLSVLVPSTSPLCACHVVGGNTFSWDFYWRTRRRRQVATTPVS
jgi:hypothetical protein